MDFTPYPFKHWNSLLLVLNIGIPTLSLQKLEFALHPLSIGICILSFWQKYWNSHLILSWHVFRSYPLNTGIRTLSFQTVASHPIFSNLGILNLPLQTLELAPYPFRALSFQRLDSHLKPFKQWNWHLILLNIRIRILYFQTLEFAPYPFIDWIRTLNLSNIGIRALSFQRLDSDPIFSNLGILNLPLQTLELAPYPFQPWKSHVICSNIGICNLSF